MSRPAILVTSAAILVSMLMPVAALATPDADGRVLLAQEDAAQQAEEATPTQASEEATAAPREGLVPADVALAETEFMRSGDGWILAYALVGFAAITGILVWGIIAQRGVAR